MTVRLDFLIHREDQAVLKVRRLERDYQRAVGRSLDHGRWTWAGRLAAYAARVSHFRLRRARRDLEAARVAVDEELVARDRAERRRRGLHVYDPAAGLGAEVGPRDTQEPDDG